jgi:hypothetical protein
MDYTVERHRFTHCPATIRAECREWAAGECLGESWMWMVAKSGIPPNTTAHSAFISLCYRRLPPAPQPCFTLSSHKAYSPLSRLASYVNLNIRESCIRAGQTPKFSSEVPQQWRASNLRRKLGRHLVHTSKFKWNLKTAKQKVSSTETFSHGLPGTTSTTFSRGFRMTSDYHHYYISLLYLFLKKQTDAYQITLLTI